MESIKHTLGEVAGGAVVRMLDAVKRGDHDSVDATLALAEFGRFARELHPVEFLAVVREALGFLSRPQRLAVGELLQAHARYSELNLPGLMKQGLQDPNDIALVLQALRQRDPELVVQLLGSEFRDLPVMKLTLAALAATAAKHCVLRSEQLR